MESIILNIEPNTKPRMTRCDKWKKRPCVMQYRAFCDRLRELTKDDKFEIGDSVRIVFHISMPATWSKKKREIYNGTAHQQTPDIDNMIKAVFDGLLEQDKTIYNLESSKWWSNEGKIIIKNL